MDLGRFLLSLPFLVSAGASLATTTQPSSEAASISAPTPEHAATPTGCSGCAAEGCANCPLMRAAADQAASAPVRSTEVRCSEN